MNEALAAVLFVFMAFAFMFGEQIYKRSLERREQLQFEEELKWIGKVQPEARQDAEVKK